MTASANTHKLPFPRLFWICVFFLRARVRSNLNVLGDEIVSVIGEDEEDDAILYQGVRDAIDHRDMTGSAFLETHEDALKLERLATLCFEQPDLAAIKAALAARHQRLCVVFFFEISLHVFFGLVSALCEACVL